MRSQHFAPEEFKAAVQLFGALQPHDKRERHVPGHTDIECISNQEIVNGRRIIPGETFHTDHSNHPRPPKATTLFAIELPSSGGDTQYVNMHDAYDDLPEATKRKIAGLKAVHVYQSKYSPRPLAGLNDDSRRNLPPPGFHPLVRTHPDNGRKALYPQSGTDGIDRRHGRREALKLIEELMRMPLRRNTSIVTSGATAIGSSGTTAASCTRPIPTTT